MSTENKFDSAKDLLFDKVENYANTSIELAKLQAIDKAADIISTFTSGLFLSLIISMFILFVNIGLSLYLGNILGETYYGFLIVSGFYLIVAILINSFKIKLIETPISNLVLDKLLKNIDLNKITNSN
jgi:hypothetical protein